MSEEPNHEYYVGQSGEKTHVDNGLRMLPDIVGVLHMGCHAPRNRPSTILSAFQKANRLPALAIASADSIIPSPPTRKAQTPGTSVMAAMGMAARSVFMVSVGSDPSMVRKPIFRQERGGRTSRPEFARDDDPPPSNWSTLRLWKRRTNDGEEALQA